MPNSITTKDIIAHPELVIQNPELFCLYFLKIPDKVSHELVPFRWNAMQKHRQAHRTKRDLILKYRQGGASTLEQAILYWKVVTKRSSTLTLSHDDTSVAFFRRMADRFWTEHPFNKPAREYSNAALTTYPETGSEALMGKAGSVEIARGANLTEFVGDECAFWADADRIIAGALQSGNPNATLLSTPNGAQGPFFEMCQAAIDGHSVWNFLFYNWMIEPAYRLPVLEPLVYDDEEKDLVKRNNLAQEQIAWRRNKKLELGRFFAQEYPEDPISCFLQSGDGYFGDLTGVFTAPDGAEWEPGHIYRAGLDFAQSKDWTDLIVGDVTTRKQVELLHVHQMSWEQIRNEIRKCYNRWRRKKCAKGHISPGDSVKCVECGLTDLETLGLKRIRAEKNSIGQPNIEALRAMGISIDAFQTDVNSKREIITVLYEAIHTGGWKLLNNPVMRNEFNSFVSIQLPSGIWTARAAKGSHDDSVMGTAMMIYDVPPQVFLGE